MGEEEREGYSPMPYYLIPPHTIEHPIKHWYTYDTNTENNSPDESDDESVADKGDSGEEQLEQPHSNRLMCKCHQHISKLQKHLDDITLLYFYDEINSSYSQNIACIFFFKFCTAVLNIF